MDQGKGEVDTSAPFGSVKEAVTRFEGSGFWIPLHFLRQPNHGFEEFDMNKVEEHAAKLENDLTMKEKESLNVLKELELTKRIIKELKLKLHQESSQKNKKISNDFLVENHEKQTENSSPASSLGLILTELKQAKMNLSKTTNDLSLLRSSVGSLNKKPEKQRVKLQTSPTFISRELEELNFEAEQFIKMAEAAKTEILQAMSGAERSQINTKTAEMKWVAAKKMEEAAKAFEAAALAEMKSLSFEDHAHRHESQPTKLEFNGMGKINEDNRSKLAILKKLEEVNQEVLFTKNALKDAFNIVEVANKRILETEESLKEIKTRNNYRPYDINGEKMPILRPTISVGEILGKKLVLGEENVEIKEVNRGENERQKVSLSQMLDRQRSDASSPIRCEQERSHDLKYLFGKRKKFGFIHLSIPLTKQSKTQGSKLK